MPIYQGDRITIKVTWKDKDGTLINPTAHVIKIYDSAGTERKSDTTPDRNPSTGVFEEDYDIPDDAPTGEWRCDWEATIAGGSKMQKIPFEVHDKSK